MKKLLVSLLMLVMAVPLWAYDFEVDGIYYNITSSSDSTVSVTYKDGNFNSYAGDVVIPDTIVYEEIAYNVISIGNSAFKNSTSLTSVAIPDGVTKIEGHAFYGCTSLATVIIPEGVTSIGTSVFESCTSLTTAIIPEGVTSIGTNAFKSCTSLTYIELPSTLTSIGSSAFAGGKDSVTGNYNFRIERTVKCNAVTPPTNTSDSFDYNYATFDVPFTSILSYKTAGTWGGTYASHEHNGLYYMPIAENEVEVTYKDTNYNSYSGDVEIPAEIIVDSIKYNVTTIGGNAFRNSDSLTNVIIPESIISIGTYAFDGCSRLTSVIISEGVTSIGDYAFDGCSRLTSVIIPEGVTSIGDYAFCFCNSLTSIELPSTLTSIGSNAFRGNKTSLASRWTIKCNAVTPPTVGENAFYSNYLILEVPFASVLAYKAVENWNTVYVSYASLEYNGLYYNHIAENEVEVTYKDTNYNSYSGEVEIPVEITVDSIKYKVTSIGDKAFYMCTSLLYIELPTTLSSIGYQAFASDSHDRKITRTIKCNSTTPPTIGSLAFCYNNVTLEVPFASVLAYKAIENWNTASSGGVSYASHEHNGLYYMPIAENEVEVTYRDTNYNSYSGEVKIPTEITVDSIKYDVTAIGDYAFYICSGLSSKINLPSSITSIGSSAFSGTESKIVKTDATTPPTITSSSLPSGTSLVLVPVGCVNAYKADSVWATYNIIAEGACDIEVTNETAGGLSKSILTQARKNLPNITSLTVHGTLNADDFEKNQHKHDFSASSRH